MALEGGDGRAGVEVPHAQGVVVGAGDDAAVGQHGHASDIVLVALEGGDGRAGVEVPHAQGPLPGAGDDAAVGQHGHAGDPVLVALEDARQATLLQWMTEPGMLEGEVGGPNQLAQRVRCVGQHPVVQQGRQGLGHAPRPV